MAETVVRGGGLMKISRPMGARVIVKDIITTLSVEERARNAGFIAIIDEPNRPTSTQGKVIAVGTDPLVQEEIHVGDTISFGRLSGTKIWIADEEFRSLEFDEIILVTREESPDVEEVHPTERSVIDRDTLRAATTTSAGSTRSGTNATDDPTSDPSSPAA
jgi:co-chaperonin GroES (HSP10)